MDNIEGDQMSTLEFKHSGQLGDIIYSLPAMRSLAAKLGRARLRLFIPNDKIAHHAPGLNHVGGNLMVSQPMFDFIAPLLQSQPYIESVNYVQEARIPASAIDFDIIRGGLLNLSAGNIKDYYLKAFGLMAPPIQPWIVPPPTSPLQQFDIVVGRSTRYLNISIDYRLLNQTQLSVGFMGTQGEFDAFRKFYPEAAVLHAKTNDARDVCHLISSARVYIGNQSLFFAIAEALQATRLLEVFEPAPNVVPSGGRCGQFLTNQGLAFLLQEALNLPPGQLHPMANSPTYVLSL
jgi:hypothetical protein